MAGIVGAARDGVGMHGVAYETSIVPIAFDESELPPLNDPNSMTTAQLQQFKDFSNKILADGFDYARFQNIKIINNSWAMFAEQFTVANKAYIDENFAAYVNAMRSYVSAGGLVVFAAGNANKPNPEGEPGLSNAFSELEKGWLAVVATNNAGTVLASYSSRCGTAKNYCLAAPASEGYLVVDAQGNLTGDYAVTTQLVALGNDHFAGKGRVPFGSYQSFFTGTSGAAPVVSGSAALVAEQFPWMTGHQLQQTLLTTATDLGAAGVDDVYGWGLVNAGAAVKGPKQFTDDWVVNVTSGTYTFSNPIGGSGGLTKQGTGTLILEGVDTYAGDTFINAGKLVINSFSQKTDVFVNYGGILGGNGRISNKMVVNSGGTLAPGNSIGTLYVNSEVTFQEGSTYEVEANVQGQSDLLESSSSVTIANGATLAFTLERGVANSPMLASRSVIAADSLSGAFSNVTSNRLFFSPILSYTDQDVGTSINPFIGMSG